jgi:hypothetical protein
MTNTETPRQIKPDAIVDWTDGDTKGEGRVLHRSRIPGHWQVEIRGKRGSSVPFSEAELTVFNPNATAPTSITRHL